MTRLEERLGRKLDARDTDHVFYTGDGTPVKIARVDDYGRCFGRLGEKGDILVWGPDGHSDYHLNLVRPALKIGDTVRLMPLGEHSWQSEREKEISLVRPVLSLVGHMIEIDRKGDGKWSQWPIDRVQLVRRKDEAVEFGRGSSAVAQQNTCIGTSRAGEVEKELYYGEPFVQAAQDNTTGEMLYDNGTYVRTRDVLSLGCIFQHRRGQTGKLLYDAHVLAWNGKRQETPGSHGFYASELIPAQWGDLAVYLGVEKANEKMGKPRGPAVAYVELMKVQTRRHGKVDKEIEDECLVNTALMYDMKAVELYETFEKSGYLKRVWEAMQKLLANKKALPLGEWFDKPKHDLVAYGVRTGRHSCKEPNMANTPKFGSSRIGVGDFVVSFNTRDEYSEREKITMAPLSLGRVAAVSMDGFTMGVELFAVNGNKIDGPSRPHAPYCIAMLRQAGVDEIEKYGGREWVVGDYVVPEKAFRNAFEQFAVCVVKVVYPEGHMLLETVRIPAGADRTLQHTARADQVRRPTIDEWHRDCMNELDVGDVVDLVPLLPIEGLQKGTRFVIERLDTQYWACLKREVFTAYYKDRNGLTYNWPAFALRIVAKKPSKEQLEKLKPTIHSALPDTYEFIDEKRPLKIKPEDKFEAKMKLDADAYIEEELEHLDKPYNPDCMICHGDGFTEELGGKWPCKDCRPEAHKFVGKTKPEEKPKPYHRINEAGEVEVCMMYHGQAACAAISHDSLAWQKDYEKKEAARLCAEIETAMKMGIVTKAQVFVYAEQAELKMKAENQAFRKAGGIKGMFKKKGVDNEGKAAGKTLPDPDGQA